MAISRDVCRRPLSIPAVKAGDAVGFGQLWRHNSRHDQRKPQFGTNFESHPGYLTLKTRHSRGGPASISEPAPEQLGPSSPCATYPGPRPRWARAGGPAAGRPGRREPRPARAGRRSHGRARGAGWTPAVVEFSAKSLNSLFGFEILGCKV